MFLAEGTRGSRSGASRLQLGRTKWGGVGSPGGLHARLRSVDLLLEALVSQSGLGSREVAW